MADENKDQASRIKIDDLPQAEQELTPEEAQEVQGGYSIGGTSYEVDKAKVKADGSVRPVKPIMGDDDLVP